MLLLIAREFQEFGFDFTHVDAVSTLDNPAIIAATIVSSCLLMLALTTASSAWQSLNGFSASRRILLILVGCGCCLVVAWIQFVLGEAFYRLYTGLGSSTSLGLYVPVVPVWVLGTIFTVVLYVFRNRQRGDDPKEHS